eukprot:358696-Chlamydomonas_euryale.AAC.5
MSRRSTPSMICELNLTIIQSHGPHISTPRPPHRHLACVDAPHTSAQRPSFTRLRSACADAPHTSAQRPSFARLCSACVDALHTSAYRPSSPRTKTNAPPCCGAHLASGVSVEQLGDVALNLLCLEAACEALGVDPNWEGRNARDAAVVLDSLGGALEPEDARARGDEVARVVIGVKAWRRGVCGGGGRGARCYPG